MKGPPDRWAADGLALAAMATAVLVTAALDLGGVLPGFFVRYLPFLPIDITVLATVASAIGYLGWRLVRARGLPREEQRILVRDPRPARALALGLASALLLTAYGSWKAMIPVLHPFGWWDRWWMELDGAVHLGAQPWDLLQPLLGHENVTVVLDRFYWLWLPLLPATILWQAWSTNDRVRPRFFLTFALSWVLLGITGAVLGSSAGPAYYDRVTGDPGPYGPLLEYLRAVHSNGILLAVRGQEFLWQSYAQELTFPYSRISAMPSMHAAMAVLWGLAGSATGPVVGAVFWAFALIIGLGAIHLGWHYAVDLYASALAVALLWKLSGMVLARGRAGAAAR